MDYYEVGTVVTIKHNGEYENMIGLVLDNGRVPDVLIVSTKEVVALHVDYLEPHPKRIVVLDGKLETISHWLDGGDIEFLHEGSWQDVDSPEVSVNVLKNFELRVKEPEKFRWVIDTGLDYEVTNGYFTEEEIKRRNPDSPFCIKVPNTKRNLILPVRFPGIPAKVEVIKV